MSNKYKWVDDPDSNTRLLILQDTTGFYQEHEDRIKSLKNKTWALRVLTSEALLVISRIAYQLQTDFPSNLSSKSSHSPSQKEGQPEVTGDNFLQILSFWGLRLEYITNVLLKNRIVRVRGNLSTEEIGLKSIWYVGRDKNEGIQESEIQGTTHYESRLVEERREEVEMQKERNRMKGRVKLKSERWENLVNDLGAQMGRFWQIELVGVLRPLKT